MSISREDVLELKKDVKDLLKGQAAIDQYIKDKTPQCRAHGADISSLKKWRFILTGGWIVIAGILTWCGFNPDSVLAMLKALTEHKK